MARSGVCSRADGFVEEGIVTLVGATTENPSFELNNALLSRAQVMVLKALDAPAMALLFRRAEEELQRKLPVSDTGRDALIGFADGDGRYGLNLAEEIFALSPKTDFDADDIAKLLQKRAPAYDKNAEAKSNAVYTAFKAAMNSAKKTGSLSPPAHILNAPTKLMKELGYGAGYAYDHDAPDGFSGQNYFPDDMPRETYYAPKGDGREAAIRERLKKWATLRETRS